MSDSNRTPLLRTIKLSTPSDVERLRIKARGCCEGLGGSRDNQMMMKMMILNHDLDDQMMQAQSGDEKLTNEQTESNTQFARNMRDSTGYTSQGTSGLGD